MTNNNNNNNNNNKELDDYIDVLSDALDQRVDPETLKHMKNLSECAYDIHQILIKRKIRDLDHVIQILSMTLIIPVMALETNPEKRAKNIAYMATEFVETMLGAAKEDLQKSIDNKEEQKELDRLRKLIKDAKLFKT